MTDPYVSLGVSRESTDDEIKSAYRKLAKQYHPDLNKTDEARAKFEEITNAYNSVKDQAARDNFDRVRQSNSRREYHFDLGAGNFEDILRNFWGNVHQQRPPQNRDYTAQYQITLEQAFVGGEVLMDLGAPINKKVTFTIPPGVDTGSRMRLQGMGDTSVADAPPGDLYVIIYVSDHPQYQRQGSTLFARYDIDAIDAMINETQTFKTLDGSEISFRLPDGAQTGTFIPFNGKGMPVLNRPGQFGELNIVVNVTLPTDITDEQKNLLRNLRKP